MKEYVVQVVLVFVGSCEVMVVFADSIGHFSLLLRKDTASSLNMASSIAVVGLGLVLMVQTSAGCQ